MQHRALEQLAGSTCSSLAGFHLESSMLHAFNLFFLVPRCVGMVDQMHGHVYPASGSGWCQTVPRHKPVRLLDLVIT